MGRDSAGGRGSTMMFRLQSHNMSAFEKRARDAFRDALGIILAEAHPGFVLPDPDAYNQRLEQVMREAEQFGFETKREITYYAFLVADYGERFYTKPRYPDARAMLTARTPAPLERLARLKEYLDVLTPPAERK